MRLTSSYLEAAPHLYSAKVASSRLGLGPQISIASDVQLLKKLRSIYARLPMHLLVGKPLSSSRCVLLAVTFKGWDSEDLAPLRQELLLPAPAASCLQHVPNMNTLAVSTSAP